ncbi:hypothetical protein ABW19_dt0200421 [Dactylella cylindrospora]|nr:hypothetical protein ABW19_dt0200421 [Dactylella cylindrospora]
MRRARLTINRRNLPAARILWPVGNKISQDPRYSVYDLLNDINVIFPLDNFNIGLEDYVVELQGCELVHFMPIGELIGDGDEITIRPLTTTESREHLKGGRIQISTNGKKLLDGVPFGRNFIVPARDRPTIDIEEPPAKRQRTSSGTQDNENDPYIYGSQPLIGDVTTPKAITATRPKTGSSSKSVHFEDKTKGAGGSSALVIADLDDDDESDLSDEDFDPGDFDEDEDESDESEAEETSGDGDGEREAIGRGEAKARAKGVTKTQIVEAKEQEDSDSSESSTDLSDSDSDSDSSSSGDSGDASLESSELSGSSDGDSSSSSDLSDADSDSDSDESELESLPEEVSSKVSQKIPKPLSKPAPITKTPPFEGTSSTKSRNKRRRETRSLNRLIRLQILPAGSTKADLYEWREKNMQQSSGAAVGAPYGEEKAEPNKLNDLKEAEPDVAMSGAAHSGVSNADSIPGRRTEGPHPVESQSPTYTPLEPLEVEVEEMEVKLGVPGDSQSQSESNPKAPVSSEASSSPIGNRRGRPVASDAAKRLIFGGLGLRKPRNEAEDEKLRSDWKRANAKYVGNKSKGFLESMVGKEGVHSKFDENGDVSLMEPESGPQAEVENPDAWKQQIKLSAVECDDDCYDGSGDRLPTPSFPFEQQQLWRNSDNSNRANKKGKQKKNKRKRDQETSYEEDNWDASYYDDIPMQVDTAQNPEVVESSQPEMDDMPPVPSNLSEYPELQRQVLPESIVVFKRLTMDKNYAPIYQQVTAKVLSIDGDHIRIQLAKRDCPEFRYDEETGEKLYGPLHMPGTEDEDMENGIEEIEFDQMMEGRVIRDGVAPSQNPEIIIEEEGSERVPETIHGDDSLDKDNGNAEFAPHDDAHGGSQDSQMADVQENAELPPDENDLSRFSGVVQQSSSFLDPHFQVNGSCGYGHSETSHDSDHEMGEGEQADEQDKEDYGNDDGAFDSIPSHQLDRSKYSNSGVNTTQEEEVELPSSTEAHRYDDLPSQEYPNIVSSQARSRTSSSQPFNTAPEARSDSRQPEEPSIQVVGTPDPLIPDSPRPESIVGENWDLSVDISALEPAEVGKIKKMVKVKKECPEDTDILREVLKPFHHPSELGDEEPNISVDISSPASPVVKRERFSTQEALESPIAALQDITERSANNNYIGNGLDAGEDGDEGNSSIGPGSGLGNNQSSSSIAKDFASIPNFQVSDDSFKLRRKTGALFHRRPGGGGEDDKKGLPRRKEDDESDDADGEFSIPSTMPVRSMTSGKTAVSGRNDTTRKVSAKKRPELVTIDSDDEFYKPPPRASLEIIGGDTGPTKPGQPRMKPQLIKRRIVSRRSESVVPEGSQPKPVSPRE